MKTWHWGALIAAGVGGWYLWSRSKKQAPQTVALMTAGGGQRVAPSVAPAGGPVRVTAPVLTPQRELIPEEVQFPSEAW